MSIILIAHPQRGLIEASFEDVEVVRNKRTGQYSQWSGTWTHYSPTEEAFNAVYEIVQARVMV